MKRLAYADNVNIIGSRKRDTVQFLIALEAATEDLVLVINQDKTNYMLVTKNPPPNPQ